MGTRSVGVIDVLCICYAERMMVGMVAICWLYSVHGLPLPAAMALDIAFVVTAVAIGATYLLFFIMVMFWKPEGLLARCG